MSTLFRSLSDDEVATLRAAVASAVRVTSYRVVAGEVGVSHVTLRNWLESESGDAPAPRTLEKVARWMEQKTAERDESRNEGSEALYRQIDQIESQPVEDLVKAVKLEALSAAIRAEAAWMEARAAVVRARAIERAEMGAESRARAIEREAESASERTLALQYGRGGATEPSAGEGRRLAGRVRRAGQVARKQAGKRKPAAGE